MDVTCLQSDNPKQMGLLQSIWLFKNVNVRTSLVVQRLKTLCFQCRGPGSLVRELDPITNAIIEPPGVGEGNGNPLQCSCLENPRDGGAWWAAVYGVAQSQTRLKRLSSSEGQRNLVCCNSWGHKGSDTTE